MSVGGWGPDPLFWVEGDVSMIRIRQTDGRVIETIHPKMQDIPGLYQNSLEGVSFNNDGVWFVTQPWHEVAPGIVYFAPYGTGVFKQVGQVPPSGDGAFSYPAFPGGVVVCQAGTRNIHIFNQGGEIHQQVLPPGFIGDSIGWRDLMIFDAVYRPRDGNIALSFVLMDSESSNSMVAVALTQMFLPGSEIAWSAPLYMAPAWGETSVDRAALAATALLYEDGVCSALGVVVDGLWKTCPALEVIAH